MNQPLPDLGAEVYPVPSPGASTGLSKQPSRSRLLLLAGVVVVGLCLCAGLSASLLARNFWRARVQKPDPQAVIDSFMEAMAHKDPQSAYVFFSNRSKRRNSLAGFKRILAGNYALFDGYAETRINAQDITTLYHADPDLPQGNVAIVSGTIVYSNGYTGSFNATLEWEAGQWRIDGINIAIPREKRNDPLKQEGFQGPEGMLA